MATEPLYPPYAAHQTAADTLAGILASDAVAGAPFAKRSVDALEALTGGGTVVGVPGGVTAAQMREALDTDLQAVIDALPASPSDPITLQWNAAAPIAPFDPVSVHIQTTLSKTDPQMATLFALARTL